MIKLSLISQAGEGETNNTEERNGEGGGGRAKYKTEATD